MRILVIGSGAREHAIVSAIARSNGVDKIFAAPGNPGIADLAECVSLPVQNISLLVEFAHRQRIDLTIVGPEQPLVLGLVDAFRAEGLRVLGPSQKAAQIEGSKIFTKELCARYNVPTAPFQTFDSLADVREALAHRTSWPAVIKADGLAAGKGVVIAQNREEAEHAATDMMLYERFGEAGRHILIEDFMPGEEASYIVLTDGERFVALPAAQDHKRIFDGDQGPNTGGMGAYAPAPIVTPELARRVNEEIIVPTLAGLRAEGRPFNGFLYAGLMIDADGNPRVVEFNCRLGDPEAEVLLPLVASDFLAAAIKAADGDLSGVHWETHNGSCAAVVMASAGYPGDLKLGDVITGCDKKFPESVSVFHAGTKISPDDNLVTAGGRVLVVSARSEDLADALKQAYQAVDQISWTGCQYRRDIGDKGLAYLRRQS